MRRSIIITAALAWGLTSSALAQGQGRGQGRAAPPRDGSCWRVDVAPSTSAVTANPRRGQPRAWTNADNRTAGWQAYGNRGRARGASLAGNGQGNRGGRCQCGRYGRGSGYGGGYGVNGRGNGWYSAAAQPVGTRGTCLLAIQSANVDVAAPNELLEAEESVLRRALLEEYRAEMLYTDAVAKFGAVRPLDNLRVAEGHHIAAVRALFDRYDLTPPSRDEADRIAIPATFAATLQAAAELEAGEGPLYTSLLESVEKDDVRAVFERLRQVSLERHLPAVQR